jgi:RNA polymerase sigma-70 factor (ECF subfamily)
LLTAEFRDVAAAEDAVSDALLAALARWPTQGVPESPEGWLVTVARRRLLDEARRTKSRSSQTADLVNTLPGSTVPEAFTIPDRRLALLFVCSHPAIEPAARAPLILQTALGFDASRIAQAFLVSPTSMAQRLVRAKRKSKTRASDSKYQEAQNWPSASTPYSMLFMPATRTVGPHLWMRTTKDAAWPKKPSGWPDCSSNSVRTNRK